MIAVFLPFMFIMATGVKPFHRGFYCDDESLKKPYIGTTVPADVVLFIGILTNMIAVCFTVTQLKIKAIHFYIIQQNYHSTSTWCRGNVCFIRPFCVIRGCYQPTLLIHLFHHCNVSCNTLFFSINTRKC